MNREAPSPAAAIALYRQGDLAGAWEAARRGLQHAPEDGEFLHVLGLAGLRLGRLADAARAFERLLAQRDDAGAAINLGTCLHRMGRNPEAVAVYRRALESAPHVATLHANLGGILINMGRDEDGIAACRRAVALEPEAAGAIKNVAVVLHKHQRYRDAALWLQRAARLAPGDAETANVLGLSYHNTGQTALAERQYRHAIALAPAHEDAWNNLAALYYRGNALTQAAAAYRRLLTVNPANVLGLNNLGVNCTRAGRVTEAQAHLRRAVCLQPDSGEGWVNLANALKDATRIDEAMRAYGRACAVDGDPYGVRLLLLNGVPEVSPERIFQEHRAWAGRHADPLTPAAAPRRPDLDGRRLRVGYVSPDLWTHSVSYFFLPLLEHHDCGRFEVFVYSDCRLPDAMTARLRSAAEHWHDTVGLSDAELAALIESHEIDVLFDLAGHTANNRLRCFARRPAPVQASWLGYPNTTGMRAMDYRLTDAIADPPGRADALASERLVRLPGGFLCYRAGAEAGAPGPGSAAAGGPPVFASFNAAAKLNARVVALWAALLRAVPEAGLVLKAGAFDDAGVAARVRGLFAAGGIAPERIRLLSWKSATTDHLAAYGAVDVALDPFPYNGTTTTCEALWMGVPVVTLLGESHAGRVGASLLARLGLTGLVARDPEDYVRRAADLVRDPARLRDFRHSLRERMRGSGLCDEAGFARRFEAAALEMAAAAQLERR